MGNSCFFVYNHGIYELITHYCDSIHNREYHNFTIVIVLFSLSLSPTANQEYVVQTVLQSTLKYRLIEVLLLPYTTQLSDDNGLY